MSPGSDPFPQERALTPRLPPSTHGVDLLGYAAPGSDPFPQERALTPRSPPSTHGVDLLGYAVFDVYMVH
jgi:hypothetical protein